MGRLVCSLRTCPAAQVPELATRYSIFARSRSESASKGALEARATKMLKTSTVAHSAEVPRTKGYLRFVDKR